MNEHKIMEKEIVALLQKHAQDHYAKNNVAPNIAKKSLLMNHLYQDLGLESRIQMGKFMGANFPTLAALKPKDTLWKKFLYDSIGKVAPACKDCDDLDSCFKCTIEEAK